MATFGDSGSGGSYFFDDVGNTQFWQKYGSFPGGLITDVYVYFAGDGASITANLLVWNTNSIIINQSVNVGSGTRAVNGQAWQHVGGLSVYCPPTSDFGIGWWSAGHVVWTGNGGSTYYKRSLAAPTGAGAFDGTEGFTPHAYVVYTPFTIHTYDGAAWQTSPGSYDFDGTTWQSSAGVLVFDGTTWQYAI